MRRFAGIFASRIGLIGQWLHIRVQRVDQEKCPNASFLVKNFIELTIYSFVNNVLGIFHGRLIRQGRPIFTKIPKAPQCSLVLSIKQKRRF